MGEGQLRGKTRSNPQQGMLRVRRQAPRFQAATLGGAVAETRTRHREVTLPLAELSEPTYKVLGMALTRTASQFQFLSP